MSNTSNSSTAIFRVDPDEYPPHRNTARRTPAAERQDASELAREGRLDSLRQNRSARSLPPQRRDGVGRFAYVPVDVGRGGNVMPAKTHRTPSPLSGSQRKLRHEQERMAKLGIPDFETPKDCAKRQEKMIRRMAGTLDEKLLRNLRRCTASECYQEPCCGACHFAMRRHRLAIIPQACELFDEEEEKYQVNIVHPSWTQPHLDGARPEAAKQWVRRRLEKLGRPILAVGSFEVTLNVELDGTRHWAGEVVMIIAGARKENIASVLKLRTRDKKRLQPHAKPIKFSSVKNLGQADRICQ